LIYQRSSLYNRPPSITLRSESCPHSKACTAAATRSKNSPVSVTKPCSPARKKPNGRDRSHKMLLCRRPVYTTPSFLIAEATIISIRLVNRIPTGNKVVIQTNPDPRSVLVINIPQYPTKLLLVQDRPHYNVLVQQ
jgi:hypothetical protein